MTISHADPTVLVVDDEPHIVELYTSWLTDNYSVTAARDGAQALALVNESINVVLLDRQLPNYSGEEVLATIRDRELSCRVAMVTAVEPGLDIIEMGFDEYLMKPMTEADVCTTVDRLLAQSEYGDALNELYALASTKAVLETANSEAALAASDEYSSLQARFEEVQSQVKGLTEEFRTVQFWAEATRQSTSSADSPAD